MYNKQVLSLLMSLEPKDYQYIAQSVDKLAEIGDGQQQVAVYLSQGKYYFKAIGSPYLLAMSHWLVKALQDQKFESYKTIDIVKLERLFDLPIYKRQDALLILHLIEQLSHV